MLLVYIICKGKYVFDMSFVYSFQHIYTSNGVSLHELSISLLKNRKFSTNENDDLCSICLEGGNLLCCDTCPRAFHKGQFSTFCLNILCYWQFFRLQLMVLTIDVLDAFK